MTPKERRVQMIADRAKKKKTKFQEFLSKKRTPLKTGKRARDMADVEKGLPRGRPSPSQMEDAKPTGTAGKAAGKTAAAGVGAGAGKAAGKAATTGQRVVAGLSAFQKAFAGARKSGKKEFEFKGKQFSTATQQDVQRAGASNLKEYLNKLKRKDTKIAKAPGQLKKGGMSKMKKYKRGGSVNEEELQKVSDRAAMIEKTKSSLGLPTAGDEVRARREAKAKRETDLALRKMERIEKMRAAGLPEGTPVRMRKSEMPEKLGRALPSAARTRARQQEEIEFIKRMAGAQVGPMEEKRLREMMGPSGMKKGGSVMARGCKMGRKKPTKLY